MNQNLFNELRKLRNEIVHGVHRLNSADLAKRFSELGLSVPECDLPHFTSILLHVFGRDAGLYYVPKSILALLPKLIEERSIDIICDPWAGIGGILASVQETTQSTKAFALSQNDEEATLGRVLVPTAEWLVGDPCQLLSTLPDNLDVVASVLPFGMRRSKPMEVQASGGTSFSLQDLGHQILAASSLRLSSDGIGIFVIPQSFFISPRSVLRQFDTLGLGITAAFALPSGAFAPYANISTYLVVIEKRAITRMFVAQLSTDKNTNSQIIENFKKGQESASLQIGRFVDVSTFKGIDALLTSERLQQTESRLGYPAVRLGDLAIAIKLGRPGNDFAFPKQENAIFVPLIGISDVLESIDGATLKHQNYAQVAIDLARSEARFVARFLNSELGREIREYNKSGTVIPKLNSQSLKSIKVSIPDLQTQRKILTIEARITAEENTLLSLQNEIKEFRRMLWADPNFRFDVSRSLGILYSRLSGDLRQQTAESLDQWFESLPFPMASILRAWQATPSDDFKTKYEHLLDFFEASAAFTGIILLSAFITREQLFEDIKKDLSDALDKQNLSLKRATFGTWKVVIEYLGKQVRQLLSSDDKEQRATCSDMFADATMQIPEVMSGKELARIFSATNKMRNDWRGHGGPVGKEEARLRNEQLIAEVQKFREETGDLWSNIKLVHAIHCRPRRGLFENEVAMLMGSNSEFLNETREMSTWLDVERLYLVSKDGRHALKLLPLVLVGPSQSSAKNACYFFSRVENEKLRFISYHFVDQSVRMYPLEEARESILLLDDI